MRTVVLGLDGLMPELLFEQLREELPHLGRLIEAGAWGRLESVTPPVTVPAWAAAMTGCDPGELGIYGFSRRVPGAYAVELVDSTDVRRETIWERAARAGRPVIVVGVPPSYPPRRVGGCLVGCCLTPDTRRQYTYPAALADEIAAVVGDYRVDVAGFRSRPKEEVRRELLATTRQRFALFRHLLRTRDWGLAVLVDMGPDRVHHAFLRHHDPRHPRHDPASPYREVVRQQYRALDEEVGALVAELPADTAVLVLSDHGARPLQGGVCLNEWLLRHGYLALKDGVGAGTPFTPEAVDWPRTRAWALGGYTGRVHLNLRGREPLGAVAAGDAAALLAELAAGLAALPGPDGAPLPGRVLRPANLYAACVGLPPDLLVEFGDLDYRALGVLGTGRLHLEGNDAGPDDANHDRQGAFVLVGAGIERGEVRGARLVDGHRVVASLLGLPDAPRASTWPAAALPSPERR